MRLSSWTSRNSETRPSVSCRRIETPLHQPSHLHFTAVPRYTSRHELPINQCLPMQLVASTRAPTTSSSTIQIRKIATGGTSTVKLDCTPCFARRSSASAIPGKVENSTITRDANVLLPPTFDCGSIFSFQ